MTKRETNQSGQKKRCEESRTPNIALNLFIKALARDAARMDYEGFSKQQRKIEKSKTQGSGK